MFLLSEYVDNERCQEHLLHTEKDSAYLEAVQIEVL